MTTLLHSLEQDYHAVLTDFQGCRVPATFGAFEQEYHALKAAAGIVDLSYRGKIEVTGSDRTPYLHRMVCNEVAALQPGEGNYAFLLDAQGRIQADCNILVQSDRILIDTEHIAADRVRALLERFVIMDDVQLEDVSARLGTLGIEGPLAREVVSAVLGIEPPHMKAGDHLRAHGRRDTILARLTLTGDGFWLIVDTEHIEEMWRKLVDAARSMGGRPAGLRALNVARVEAGIPRYGDDITEANIPQETGQFRALSFTKGCYPGQEIVERVRSRGHVNRRLVGLTATPGTTLAAQARIHAGEREAGVITTAVHSPGLGVDIALGYMRREFADPGTRVEVNGGHAQVEPLPFPRLHP